MFSSISMLTNRFLRLKLCSIKSFSILQTPNIQPARRGLITISSKLDKPPQKKSKRLGRGGKGKTGGRGRKGWHAKHSQGRMLRAHEGGQSSIAKRFPKIGIQAKQQVKELKRVLRPFSLEKLQVWIDLGRIDPSKPITMKEICNSGIAGKVKNGAVLLGSVENVFLT
jgi:large subunit ribosomal protein L15